MICLLIPNDILCIPSFVVMLTTIALIVIIRCRIGQYSGYVAYTACSSHNISYWCVYF